MPARTRLKARSRKNRRRAIRPRAELERRLIAAGTKLFSEKGYRGTSIRDLTSQAGVALPVLYWFFRSKRALYAECHRRIVESIIEALSLAIEDLHEPRAMLYEFTRTLCEQNIHLRASKIVHRVLLDADRSLLRKIAPAIYGANYSERILAAAAALVGRKAAPTKMMALYSLAAGIIEHGPLWEFAPGHQWRGDDPERIAQLVLDTVFPDAGPWRRMRNTRAKRS